MIQMTLRMEVFLFFILAIWGRHIIKAIDIWRNSFGYTTSEVMAIIITDFITKVIIICICYFIFF